MEYSDSVCGRGDRARCAFLELALQGHPSIGDFQHGGKPLTVASELVTRLHAKGYERLPGGEPPVMFQVHVAFADTRELVAQLHEAFRGTGLHYWISPLIEAGPIP